MCRGEKTMTGSNAHIHIVEISPLLHSQTNAACTHSWVAVASFSLFFSLEIGHLVQS